MKRLFAGIFALTLLGLTPASAHQPVLLRDTDTTPAKGPLLVDGTVSFAVQASFAKAGQKKAFRAALNAAVFSKNTLRTYFRAKVSSNLRKCA